MAEALEVRSESVLGGHGAGSLGGGAGTGAAGGASPSRPRPRRRPRFSLPVATLLLVLVIPLTLFFVMVWLTGNRLQVVQTGSMEPTYPRGSLVVVEPIDPSQVRVGQSLMFEAPWKDNDFVTHRVRSIDTTNGLTFVTRGDANDTDDPFPVPARNVRGVVRWNVPNLGSLLWELRFPRAPIFLVAIPAVLYLLAEVGDRRRRKRTVSCPVAAGGRCPMSEAPSRADGQAEPKQTSTASP